MEARTSPDYRAPAAGAIADPARLAALDELELLDTAPEEVFDRITRVASISLGVPVSLVTLLDHDRQFFKSGVGLPEGVTNNRLAASFCPPVIETREPLSIDDARLDPRVRDHPAIAEFGVVAYAGAPLIMGSGHAVGTICALDTTGHAWTERDMQVLSGLAEIVTAELEQRRVRIRERHRTELLQRRLGEGADRLRLMSDRLDESDRALERSREETVHRIARAVQTRSEETGAHMERMSRICGELGAALGLDHERCEMIRRAGMLHDVGKIAIPDAILTKPGPLTRDERAQMQCHTVIGADMLAGSDETVLDLAALIARTHHEWVDGCGYPHRLVGEQIPIEGRIAAVADVFEALTSDRVYRPAMSVPDALRIMEDERGRHFDPQVLDALQAQLGRLAALDEAAAASAAGPGPTAPRNGSGAPEEAPEHTFTTSP